jgi:two-component system sensor histidine kinase TctE
MSAEPRPSDLAAPAPVQPRRGFSLAPDESGPRGQPSLFNEILDWMLAPMLVIWPVSVALIYALAYSIANQPYDRALSRNALALANQVSAAKGKVSVNFPTAASAILRADEADEVYFQVRGPRGEVLAGDPDMHSFDRDELEAVRNVYFRSDTVRAAEVRVAYLFLEFRGVPGTVLVQVGETLDKRNKLANEIINGVLASQILMVPIALFLVWYGLTKGIEPLNTLREKIRGRRPNDLSPIDPDEAPEEVRPFIHSINDLMAQLAQSLLAQQRFVADAAHQMRTPLAGLKTQAELVLRQSDRREVEHAMRQIAASADRASRMVTQLLALARADSDAPGGARLLDLNTLAREATLAWVPRALEKRIDLGFEGAETPALVDCDPVLMNELLGNLIDNALRYTPAGGHVTTRVRCANDVTVEVEDSGIGVDEADRELVFERFYRVLGTGTEGSGLGLAIVRAIAEAHRGRAFLLPNPGGRGTLVSVILPSAAPRPPAA